MAEDTFPRPQGQAALMEWSAPQYVMAAMLAISVVVGYLQHGHIIKINGWPKLVNTMLVAIVLYWGGFWS